MNNPDPLIQKCFTEYNDPDWRDDSDLEDQTPAGYQ